MLIGQQVRVTGERGPLEGLVGTVEEAHWEDARSFYFVRGVARGTGHEVEPSTWSAWFRVHELERISYCYEENEHPDYERLA